MTNGLCTSGGFGLDKFGTSDLFDPVRTNSEFLDFIEFIVEFGLNFSKQRFVVGC